MVQRFVSNVCESLVMLAYKRSVKCASIPLLACSSSLTNLQTFCQEAVMWKHLTHPNIVPLLGVTMAPFQLILDWMPGGDLREYIKENPDADRLGLVGLPLVTGGKGSLTQWVHCEFVVGFEAIRPVITQWVCGEFF